MCCTHEKNTSTKLYLIGHINSFIVYAVDRCFATPLMTSSKGSFKVCDILVRQISHCSLKDSKVARVSGLNIVATSMLSL